MSDIRRSLEALSGTRLCVIGDVILDEFIWGSVERVSPEAPVPVLLQERVLRRASGAAAAVQAAAGLGARVEVLGVVGDDEAGELTRSLLREVGASARLVRVAGRPTTVKTRMIAQGQHLLRLDRESTEGLSASHTAELAALGREMVSRADGVLISDYAKGVCTAPLVASVVDDARTRNVPVVADPKRADPCFYAGATAVTPNAREFAAFCRTLGRPTDDLAKAARWVRETAAFGSVVVTRAEEGMTVVDGRHIEDVPAYSHEVLDVAGAGDAAAAVLTLCLAAGLGTVTGARIASLVAGLAVGRWEDKCVTPDEVRRAAEHFGL